jgi:hypothetical protein
MGTKVLDVNKLLEDLARYGVKEVMIGLRKTNYKAVIDVKIEGLKNNKKIKVKL